MASYTEVVTDSTTMAETLIFGRGMTAIDSTTLTDVPVGLGQALKTISETVNLSLSLTVYDVVLLAEKVVMATTISDAGSSANHIVTENIKLQAAAIVAWDIVAAETANMTATPAMSFEWVKVVAEKLQMADIVVQRADAVALAAVTVALAEVWESGKGADASESVTFTAALLDSAIMLAIGAEALAMSESLDDLLLMYPTATDFATFNEAVTPNQILQQVITDGVSFNIMFGLEGDVYQGWVMNVDNFAVSEYQNYPFNSFAKVGDKYYGANDNGIYLLEGADDAGTNIDALIATGKVTFRGNLSRVQDAYLALRTDNSIVLKTVADDDKERWYELTDVDWTLRDKRVKLGRGVKSRYWQFKICNENGGDFEVDSLTLLPVNLKRR